MGDFVNEVISHASPTSSTHVPTFETTAAIQRERKRCCLRGLQADCLPERWLAALAFIEIALQSRTTLIFRSIIILFFDQVNSVFSENRRGVNWRFCTQWGTVLIQNPGTQPSPPKH